MSLHLEKNDYLMIGIGISWALILAVINPFLATVVPDAMLTELILDSITVLVILAAIITIYQARSAWGGQMSRNLEILGAGLAVFMISWIPHIFWHVTGEPAWLGLSTASWIGIFHGIGAGSFFIMAYGFYRFWKDGPNQ